MINVTSEQTISLTEAAKLLPRRRGGKAVHVSCLYRWTTNGCRGVKLEFFQCGGTRATSHEALARFFEQLTAAQTGTPPSSRTAAQRHRSMTRAEQELEADGI
jgi:hypothetical protein